MPLFGRGGLSWAVLAEDGALCGDGAAAAAAEKADAGTTVGGARGGNSIFLAT